MKKIEERVIIVAGGAGGIGAATCELLSSLGGHVVVANRKNDRLKSLLEKFEQGDIGALFVDVDLRFSDEWGKLIEIVMAEYGRIDVLINCVGNLFTGSFESLHDEAILDAVHTNLLSTFYGAHSVIPVMRSQGHGHIVHVGSLGGIVPMPHESLYSSLKFAVRGFSLSLGEELRGTGICVSLLSPGSVRTRMLDVEATDDRSTISFIQKPMTPETVAAAIVQTIQRPRQEVILPRMSGIPAFILNCFPRIFSLLYPLMNRMGRKGMRSYRKDRLNEPGLTQGEN